MPEIAGRHDRGTTSLMTRIKFGEGGGGVDRNIFFSLLSLVFHPSRLSSFPSALFLVLRL